MLGEALVYKNRQGAGTVQRHRRLLLVASCDASCDNRNQKTRQRRRQAQSWVRRPSNDFIPCIHLKAIRLALRALQRRHRGVRHPGLTIVLLATWQSCLQQEYMTLRTWYFVVCVE
jgi:hypothetical protein